MTQKEFHDSLDGLLMRTLAEGPGPREVAHITAHALVSYIMNEAGGMAPTAVEEVVTLLRGRIAAALGA